MSSEIKENDSISKYDQSEERYQRDVERIKEFRRLLLSSSTEETLNKINDNDFSVWSSQGQNDKETKAAVGTSQKSSNRKQPKSSSQVFTEKLKTKPEKHSEDEQDNEDLDSASNNTESYEINKLNLMETLALLESDEDTNENESNKSQCSKRGKLENVVLTILLVKKWKEKKNNEKKEAIRYQPTYRLEPKDNLNLIKYLIVKKIKNTFETLCEKHKYDIKYTPKFLKVITELIKNDAKSFRLDRYKIVAHVTILQKVLKQSIQFISKELFSIDDDHKLSFRLDMISFHAVCLVFFVYHE